MSFRLQKLTPMLQTGDMQRAIDWYSSVLGFRCTARMGDGWCTLERDGVALMLMRNDHLGPPHAMATQYFRVDDVRALWSSIRDRVTRRMGVGRNALWHAGIRDQGFRRVSPELRPAHLRLIALFKRRRGG